MDYIVRMYQQITGEDFMDVLAELEKIGDFLINVSQAIVGKYEDQKEYIKS